MPMQRSVKTLPFSSPCFSCHWFVEPKNSNSLSDWKLFAVRFMQVPEPCTAEHLELTGCEPKPPFLCLSYVHMVKHSKNLVPLLNRFPPTLLMCKMTHPNLPWWNKNWTNPSRLYYLFLMTRDWLLFSLVSWLKPAFSLWTVTITPCTRSLSTRLPTWHAMQWRCISRWQVRSKMVSVVLLKVTTSVMLPEKNTFSS